MRSPTPASPQPTEGVQPAATTTSAAPVMQDALTSPRVSATATAAADMATTQVMMVPTTVTLRVLLNAKGAGVAIGRGGKTIEELRDVSGCKAGVSKAVEGVNDRILTVVGPVPNAAQAIHFLATTLVATPCMTFQPPLPETHTMVRLLVPNAVMGTVIGRGGSRIKQLQEQHGVRLVAAKDPLPHSTERLCDVTGTPDAIMSVAGALAQTLLDDWDRVAATTVLYDPHVRVRTAPQAVAAAAALAAAAHANAIPVPRTAQAASVAAMAAAAAAAAAAPAVVYPAVAAPVVAAAPAMIPNGHAAALAAQQRAAVAMTAAAAMRAAAAAPYPAAATARHHAYAPAAYMVPSHHPHPHQQQQSHSRVPSAHDDTVASGTITQTLAVPGDLVGSVIGKGGARVAEMRESSGARILIAKAANDRGERVLTVSGTPAQVDTAVRMVVAQIAGEKGRREARAAHAAQMHAQAAAAAAAVDGDEGVVEQDAAVDGEVRE
ncbi:RNA binding protein, heterogenous nuclear RNP-K like protein [Allomyces arbusculus]|nr:RNA binding protein, heterogenous nuclear RNP-K like protein [Allomyces arbusculus]